MTRAPAEGLPHILVRLKRVRNPDMVSLELLEHFLKQAEAAGVSVWLAGLKPDLLDMLARVNFPAWVSQDRSFPQGKDEDSATLAAIRGIRASLGARKVEGPEFCRPENESRIKSRRARR